MGRVARLFGRLAITLQVVDVTRDDIEFAEKADSDASHPEVVKAVGELPRRLSD